MEPALAMRRTRGHTTPAGRRHIIERPRLTRLLDEATAKVITLVAPAGYGKTTLARQWLANRPHVWLQANEASPDVVALASQVAKALAPFGRGTHEHLLARLRTIRDVRLELRSLAELQAQELDEAPDDTWMIIDDYEYIARSAVAEEYFRLLLENVDLRFLIASRVRPAWATARAVLYGEIRTIDRGDLAMQDGETRAVLQAAPETRVSEIVELADGWPALVGLASLTDLQGAAAGDLPRPVFGYLADELFHRCSRVLQAALPHLALAPRVTPEVAAFILGPRKGPRLLAEAAEVGFFSEGGTGLNLHPLLRTFLLTKLTATERQTVGTRLVTYFLARSEWDDAFELIRELRFANALVHLCDLAYEPMLSRGRASTLETWLQLAAEFGLASGVVVLIRAELALRYGNTSHAQRLADDLITSADTDAYLSRAFAVAGRAAHLESREGDALRLFRSAARTARDDEEAYEAMWGSLLSAEAFESEDELLNVLGQFLSRQPRNANDILRAANARLMVSFIVGGVTGALQFATDAQAALDHADDPLIRTSFLNNLSRALSLQARYVDASSVAERLVADAKEAKLEFVLPHAYVTTAVAQIGRRDLERAETVLAKAEHAASRLDDWHNVVDARNVRAKLAISGREFARAVELTRDVATAAQVTTTMRAELLATAGLAQACVGDTHEAHVALSRAESLSSFPEIRSLAASARAVMRLQRDDTVGALDELRLAFDFAILDPVVIVCRAFPELATKVFATRGQLATVVHDVFTIPDASQPSTIGASLTTREREVLKLITRGYTNREIASELVIAEVTAKVHVHNVIRKLGVRSRTEAAITALRCNYFGSD